MDTAQWPQQGIINNGGGGRVVIEKHIVETKEEKIRGAAGKEEALKCPRCNSCNTKFCYYNNYSLTQPRYFCKTCRRYWTQGGTLRTVPVGGGSRKNKRPSSSSSNSYNNSLPKKQVITTTSLPPPQPPLNLMSINEESYLFQNPSFASSELSLGCSYVPTTAADLTNNNNMFSSFFPFQEFKPTLNYFAYHNNINHVHLITGNNNGVHQQTPAKVDGFDQINQAQADRDSIGLLNNGMLTGGVWQL